MENLIKATKLVMGNYVGFSGRATRSEFWYYYLAYTLVYIAVFIVGGIIGSYVLTLILGLAVFLPGLAVDFRRLHDTGRSAWWMLIAITGIGIIVLIIFFAQPSKDGDNSHGPKPTF